MHLRHLIILMFTTLYLAATSHAQGDHTMQTDPISKENYFILKSPKGYVRFNHDLHVAEMKTEICIPCHKTNTPTKANTMTRFDERIAHHFCKGCHEKRGRGPVECHECHKEKKTFRN